MGAKLSNKGVTTTWVRVEVDKKYLKKLEDFYALPWYKRLFKRLPK